MIGKERKRGIGRRRVRGMGRKRERAREGEKKRLREEEGIGRTSAVVGGEGVIYIYIFLSRASL